jgi:hypothetical protein
MVSKNSKSTSVPGYENVCIEFKTKRTLTFYWREVIMFQSEMNEGVTENSTLLRN